MTTRVMQRDKEMHDTPSPKTDTQLYHYAINYTVFPPRFTALGGGGAYAEMKVSMSRALLTTQRARPRTRWMGGGAP